MTSRLRMIWRIKLFLARRDFDAFQIVVVSLIAEFSFPFSCYVFEINQYKSILKLNLRIIILLQKRTPNKFIA